MLHSGLVSVSFRRLSAGEIIKLAAESQLEAIEWGGDVHVPHGDTACARRVRIMTEDAGLKVSSYGSYYFAGRQTNPEFEPLLETAVELGAPVIRIWAGDKSSAESGPDRLAAVAEDASRVCLLSGKAHVSVAFEYHPNTLTDTVPSSKKLLDACPGALSYWQPPAFDDTEENVLSLQAVLPRLSNVHVFHWGRRERFPLARGIEDWKKYMAIVSQAHGDHYCLLEFFKDDSINQFRDDAKTLIGLLSQHDSALEALK